LKIVLAVLAVLTLASGAAAQAQPGPCRAVPAVHDIVVDLYRGLFYDDDEPGDSAYAQFREYFGTRKLAPSEPVTPIRDAAVCEEWLPAITAALQSQYGAQHTTDNYLFEMIQFGPYMLVLCGIDLETVPPGVNVYGSRIDVLVFEVTGRRYLGTMLS
jgi:hypothetical protein